MDFAGTDVSNPQRLLELERCSISLAMQQIVPPEANNSDGRSYDSDFTAICLLNKVAAP